MQRLRFECLRTPLEINLNSLACEPNVSTRIPRTVSPYCIPTFSAKRCTLFLQYSSGRVSRFVVFTAPLETPPKKSYHSRLKHITITKLKTTARARDGFLTYRVFFRTRQSVGTPKFRSQVLQRNNQHAPKRGVERQWGRRGSGPPHGGDDRRRTGCINYPRVCVTRRASFGSSLYFIHYTSYTIHYTHTFYLVHNTSYTIHYTLYMIHYTPYMIHYTPYMIHYTPYMVHYTPCIIHRTPYTIIHPLTKGGPKPSFIA